MYPVNIMYKDYKYTNTTLLKITKVLDEFIFLNDRQMNREYRGHVLVFCTCIDEINQLV